MPKLGCEAMSLGIPGGVCRKPPVGSIDCIDGATRSFCREHMEMVRAARKTIAPPTATALTLDLAIECVKCSIAHVEEMDRRFRDAEGSAQSTLFERMVARARRVRAEEEFGWQWRNVKRILKDKEI